MNVKFGQAYLLQQSKAKPSKIAKWFGLNVESRQTAKRFDDYIATHYPGSISESVNHNTRLVLDESSTQQLYKEMETEIKQSRLDRYDDDGYAFGFAYAHLFDELLLKHSNQPTTIDLDA